MQILIVDDDRIQRLILRNQLVRLGYDVSEASDAVSAWILLQLQPAPIVITDLDDARAEWPRADRTHPAAADRSERLYTASH